MLRRLPLLLLCPLLLAPLGCDSAQSPSPHGGAGAGGAGGAGGYGGGEGGAEAIAPVPTVRLDALVIQPGGGRDFLLDALESATASVRVVSWILTDDVIEDALVATAARGIDVRAIVPADPVNEEAREKLARGGVLLDEGNPAFALTHEKAVVVDDDLAFVLNQNLSYSGFEWNREYNAVITGKPARDVAAIFDADWERRAFAEPTDLVVSPSNARSRLETLLQAATESIDIAMEVMNDGRTIDLVAAKATEGLVVRVLLEDPAAVEDNAQTAQRLQQAGVQVRWLASPDLHAKAVVIDGRFAYVGSVNFTWSSLSRNRELGLVTADGEAVARILSTFDGDFAKGRTDFR